MQGRNFPDRPQLGTYQRPTSSRGSLARSRPPTAGARRADGAAETLAQVLDLDVVIFWPAPFRVALDRRSAASMTPRQGEGKTHDGTPGRWLADHQAIRGEIAPANLTRVRIGARSSPLGAFVLLDPCPHDLVVLEPLIVRTKRVEVSVGDLPPLRVERAHAPR
jgi:hypothetical protein